MPVLAFSQCPHWVGEDHWKVRGLAPIVEKYLEFKMNIDTSDINMIVYKDKGGFSTLKISVAQKNILRGTEAVSIQGNVTYVYLEGPADRIDKLVTEYFTPLLSPCKPQISPTSIVWGSYRLSYLEKGEHEGIPMKYLVIEKP